MTVFAMVIAAVSSMQVGLATSASAGQSQQPLLITSTTGPSANGTNPVSLPLTTSGGSVAGLDAYVANYISNGSVSVVNTQTDTITATVPVAQYPTMAVENAAGTYVYVLSPLSDNVTVIATSDDAVVATISVGDYPTDFVINPQGTFAYVTNKQTDTVSVINLATNVVTSTVTVGNGPNDIAFSPSGNYAYVTDSNDVSLAIINTSNFVVSFVTTGPGADPDSVAINPAGTFAYVTNTIGPAVVINLNTDAVVVNFSVGYFPTSIAINPQGTYAYVMNEGFEEVNNVSVVSLATNAVTGEVSVPEADLMFPNTITFNPAGTYAYVTSTGAQALTIINLSNDTATSAGLDSGAVAMALNANGTLAYALDSDYIQVVNTATGAIAATVSPTLSSGNDSISIALNNTAISYVATSGSAGCSILRDILTAQSAGTCVVTGTMAGDESYNSVSSSPTTVTFPAATSPGTPTDVSSTPKDSSASVNWSAPLSNGGSQILGYSVSATNVSTSTTTNDVCPGSVTITSTSCTVSSLINGDTYTFSVAAINLVGTGPISAASPQVTPIATSSGGGGSGGVGGGSTGGGSPPTSNPAPPIPPPIGLSPTSSSIPIPREVTYSANSSALNVKAEVVLDDLVTRLENGASVTITGFAHGNRVLARKRAEIVAAYLRKKVSIHVTIKFVTSGSVAKVSVITTKL
jgi:YVTN family beta-propeller protein